MQTLEPLKLENVTLYYRAGASDKVYQCQIAAAGELFVVNFAYGRRGSTLNTGTKTNVPVGYADAKRVFDQLVKEKASKGYTPGQEGTPYTSPEAGRQPSGLLPQLLNPIEEKQVPDLISDDNYCAQKKHNGKHLLVRKEGDEIAGINKQGFIIGLPVPVFEVVQGFEASVVIDGESIGDSLFAFDLLLLDGVDIRDWPYRERLAALMNLLFSVQQTAIKLVETAFTTEQKLALLRQLKAEHAEGIVFKQIFAPCTPGKPSSGGPQLKHKFVATLSGVVAKINRQRSVQISLLGRNGWQTAGNVTIPANHRIPRVGAVVELRYLYAHSESDVLYQPVYLGERDDVAAKECLTSQLKYKAQDDEG